LETLVDAPRGCETALIAWEGDEPAGVCLLVAHELPPALDLSPWLASLYVVPQFRGRGIARALIGAIEEQARSHGIARLHLYTGEAEGLYAKCGWQVAERLDGSVLMTRDLD
jgi:GNAT superfamily N-acetyltransferase